MKLVNKLYINPKGLTKYLSESKVNFWSAITSGCYRTGFNKKKHKRKLIK